MGMSKTMNTSMLQSTLLNNGIPYFPYLTSVEITTIMSKDNRGIFVYILFNVYWAFGSYRSTVQRIVALSERNLSVPKKSDPFGGLGGSV